MKKSEIRKSEIGNPEIQSEIGNRQKKKSRVEIGDLKIESIIFLLDTPENYSKQRVTKSVGVTL